MFTLPENKQQNPMITNILKAADPTMALNAVSSSDMKVPV